MEQVGEELAQATEQTREVLDAEAQRLKEGLDNEAQRISRNVKKVAKKFPKTLGAGAIVAAVVDENVLTGGHGAWDIHRNEDDETDDDEVYIDVQANHPRSDEVGNEWRGRRRAARGGGCHWFRLFHDLHFWVEFESFSSDTQRLKFNAQLTITVEWLVDEKGYASYENFWNN